MESTSSSKTSFPQRQPPENGKPSMIVHDRCPFFDAARNGSTRISRCRSRTPGWNWRIGNMPAIGRHTAAVRRAWVGTKDVSNEL
jgi:hypothetical protein